MTISKKEVKHIAHLARLNVSDKEIDLFQKDLREILGYVDRLKALKTQKQKNIMTKRIFNVFRKDKISTKRSAHEIRNLLKEAPERKGNFFKVLSVFK